MLNGNGTGTGTGTGRQTCKNRKIADCEFFINKRDYPQLKTSPTTGR
jgi:hypothetical protein